MKFIAQGVAGVTLIGLCMLQGPAAARTGANGPYYLRAIPSGAVHHLQAPHIHLRDGTSLNWSGYAVETNLANPESNAVSKVAGSWTVPTATGGASTRTYAYSSAWAGIDGYSSDSVEQIGTEQDWTPRGAQYYAWFEMYPNYAYEIVNFPVYPGDVITATVAYTGSKTVTVQEGFRNRPTSEVEDTFQLTITNLTHKATYTTSQPIQGDERSSAEWIMEAPSEYSVLPLADFGTIAFYGCSATINGVAGPIGNAAWQYDALTMETSASVAKAVPSALLLNGTAFSVTWDHQ